MPRRGYYSRLPYMSCRSTRSDAPTPLCSPCRTTAAVVPPDYDAQYRRYAAEGARVIALAHKVLPPVSGLAC